MSRKVCDLNYCQEWLQRNFEVSVSYSWLVKALSALYLTFHLTKEVNLQHTKKRLRAELLRCLLTIQAEVEQKNILAQELIAIDTKFLNKQLQKLHSYGP